MSVNLDPPEVECRWSDSGDLWYPLHGQKEKAQAWWDNAQRAFPQRTVIVRWRYHPEEEWQE